MTPRSLLLAAAILGALGTAALFAQRRAVASEIASLNEASAAAVEGAADARLAAEVDRIRLALEQARARTARTADAHLALALGDGQLTLERGEIVLRSALVNADVPRGIHRVEQVADREISLSGGIRLVPESPRDSTAAPAGTIRVSRLDFDAIRPNLKAGFAAYFF